MTDDHLQAKTTDRGFDHMPEILSTYPGGRVRVYESSAASGPHIWLSATAPSNLNEPGGSTQTAAIHLTAESAWQLADQLRLLVSNHYQGDARPGGGEGQPDPGPRGTWGGLDPAAADELAEAIDCACPAHRRPRPP